MNDDSQEKPISEETEISRRNKSLIVLATVILVALPLILGAMRLMGYI